MRRLWLFALLSAAACGDESYIILAIDARCGDAACTVPADLDGIRVNIAAAGEAGAELAQPSQLALRAGETFPVDLLVEPSDETPSSLRYTLAAVLAETVLVDTTIESTWERDATTRVPVILGVR
jgi:hypothetical protein